MSMCISFFLISRFYFEPKLRGRLFPIHFQWVREKARWIYGILTVCSSRLVQREDFRIRSLIKIDLRYTAQGKISRRFSMAVRHTFDVRWTSFLDLTFTIIEYLFAHSLLSTVYFLGIHISLEYSSQAIINVIDKYNNISKQLQIIKILKSILVINLIILI